MARFVRSGAAALAVVGSILAVVAVTSAALVPPFTISPSYVGYGAIPSVGTSSVTATGSGSNKVWVAPQFNASTGVDRQSETSTASGSGSYGIEVYSGAQNITFACAGPSTCGTRTVDVLWNVSWFAHIATTCPLNASGSSLYATVSLGILASVVDQTTSAVAGSKTLTIFSHSLYASGSRSGFRGIHLYNLPFKIKMIKGHSYAVVTYLESYSFASASSPAGALCSSVATEKVGIRQPTWLESIFVA